MAKRKADHLNGAQPSRESDTLTNKHHKTHKSASDVLIDDANALSPPAFQSSYIPESDLIFPRQTDRDTNNQSLRIDSKHAPDLSPAELNACFDLIETTSRADYEPSTFGWHPRRKRREMMEQEMRYLLVRSPSRAVSSSSRHTNNNTQLVNPITAFTSFMLTHDSLPAVPVLYVYEIHIAAGHRGHGLGSHLMSLVERIAARVGVTKTMLTCFASNGAARTFYERRGYAVDVSSPGERAMRVGKVVRPDYVIMSRDVVVESARSGG